MLIFNIEEVELWRMIKRREEDEILKKVEAEENDELKLNDEE